ncbi:insulinase family protein [Acinetobacter rathckeae]|uniref:insulinase family protein n=1 Tax=Acinetobacter rathckeae TaxID=2605272 RepID=UPI0018A2B87F|nr:insulinase family protein [Acinetobacter rathckeae]MBF7687679.1 insulinase family protein [Acinetobacter rathckeae]MBF7695081.1 insulinase family protein [Acinetobacter rathckeae]
MTVAVTETQKNTHEAFEFVRKQYVEALDVEVSEYRHGVTGAIHYHLASQNTENVFLVAFRTQPMDSKGTAHILEHTVLCGSEKFPVRDPFFLMIRRSLNTFMNAFTAADWTAYPFATENKKDYFNLLSVYLDAAFATNLNPLDFAQEGIRVELENDKPVFKGVVFNEMKGAMSSPSDQLYHRLAHHLFPETTYHYNSGGEPSDIPDLTHEQLVAFYKKHYHPSNAIFMTFGDLPVVEIQEKIQQQALVNFTRGETIYSKPERRLTAPVEVVEPYAVDSTELKDKTYHVVSWLLPEVSNIKLRLGMRLVEGILLENSASPLRQYLETCDYAESSGPFMGVDDSNFEMTFFCGVQGSNPEHAQQFQDGVLNILKQVAAKPVDATEIESILHQIELTQREITGGTPYGLSLIMNGMGSLIHHNDPLAVWDVDSAIEMVRAELKDPMWLSNLIQTYLLDNPHRVLLTLVPDAEKTQRDQAAEQARLDAIEATLTAEQRTQIIQQTEDLKRRQDTVDDLNLLPKVGLEDIPESIDIMTGEAQSVLLDGQATPLHVYHAGTNGLYYQQVAIEVPLEVVQSPYFSLLSILMGEVGAGQYNYLELQQLQTAVSGGFGMGVSLRSGLNDKNEMSSFLSLTTKSLTKKLDAIALLKLAFADMRFDEKDRIIELLQERKTRWQSRISGAGHSYAMQIASRAMNTYAEREYFNTGLGALNWLADLIKKIESDPVAYADFITQMQSIQQRLLQSPKQFLLVSEEQHSASLVPYIEQAWQNVNVTGDVITLADVPRRHVDGDQAWLVQTNVQFCSAAYPVVAAAHPDAVALMVLSAYLRNGFLHSALREKGGAYGGGAAYDANSCSFRFYSYRDPRLAETFADFERSVTWLLTEEHQDHQLEEAILGLVASMDRPTSPAGEAITAFYAQCHDRTPEFRQKMRQNLLAVTLDDVKRVAVQYLQNGVATRGVVAPFAKREELEQLGFDIQQLN